MALSSEERIKQQKISWKKWYYTKGKENFKKNKDRINARRRQLCREKQNKGNFENISFVKDVTASEKDSLS